VKGIIALNTVEGGKTPVSCYACRPSPLCKMDSTIIPNQGGYHLPISPPLYTVLTELPSSNMPEERCFYQYVSAQTGEQYQIQSFKKTGQKNHLLYIASYGLYEERMQ